MYYLLGIFILYIIFIVTGGRARRMKYKIKKTMTYEHVTVIEGVDEVEHVFDTENIITETENFTIENFVIKSKYVEEEMDYFVVLPKSYDPTKSYPAVFLLHGLRDVAYDWIDKARLLETYKDLLEKKNIGNMIFILPNSGFEGESWYSDFKKRHNRNYETYFVEELIPHVKEKYNIKNIGISGFSMGGYGAFKLGLKHLELFKVIGSFAGAVSLVRLSINKRITRIVKFIYLPSFLFRHSDKEKFIIIFGSWGRKIIKEDPYTLIKQLNTTEQQSKHFYLSVGSEDKEPYYMVHQWVDMVGRVKRFNLPLKAYLYKGETHRWEFVAKDLGNFLKYSWKYLK